jgi:hypothetical protein
MSGFKEDVISILKHNNMYHRDASGLILGKTVNRGLVKELQEKMFPVVDHYEKFIVRFDYIVIGLLRVDVTTLIKAFATVNTGGLIILELDNYTDFENKYTSLFGGFSADVVKYEDRGYLVIHSGVDYGN